MSIYRGAGGASDATDDSTVNAVAGYASSASTSASNAATSAGQAATSAATAGTNATSAAASASNAATQASNSASSAVSAASSVTAAAAQVTAATAQASAALNSASAASTSATQAGASATVAATQASTSTAQASIATAKAAESAVSAASALAIYGNTTAMNAAVSNASTSASNSANSAATSTSKASEAAASAVSAASSASAALNSANSANSSASSAQSSANTATSSATTAAADVVEELRGYVYASSVAADNAAMSEYVTSLYTADALRYGNEAGISAQQAAVWASNAASVTGAGNGQFNSVAVDINNGAVDGTVIGNNVPAVGQFTALTTTGNMTVPLSSNYVAATLNRPSIRPSLLLDFANTRTLDPRITFARASTATFYDDKTTAVAEQNLLLQSQNFSNAVWIKKDSSATSNSIISPLGDATASKVVDNAINDWHGVYQPYPALAGAIFTYSTFVKAGEYRYVGIQLADNPPRRRYSVIFDLLTGSVLKETQINGPTNIDKTISNYGNGWYRISVTMSVVTAGPLLSSLFLVNSSDSVLDANGFVLYTGDGTSGVYIWGAQLEQRSSVTAYTPTTTAAITNYIPVLQTAASGVARFDCNPVTRESLGLLIEESRTNLFTYSGNFGNGWLKVNTTNTDPTNIAPDGTQAAFSLLPTTLYGYHFIEKAVTLVIGTLYTVSFYAKAAGYTTAWGWNNVNGAAWSFNLVDGTSTGGGTITAVGNGWYRCTYLYTPSSTSGQVRIYANSSSMFSGDDYRSILVWGAQVEAGSFATSYIPTVASQVTRAADSASMTGTNFSSWYNQSQGTIYAEGQSFDPTSITTGSADSTFCCINDGTLTNSIAVMRGDSNSNLSRFNVILSGVNQANIQQAIQPANTFGKISGSYKTNDFAMSFNGAAASTDTSGMLPVVNQMQIGGFISSAGNLDGTIKRIAYYPKALTSTELQGLTS